QTGENEAARSPEWASRATSPSTSTPTTSPPHSRRWPSTAGRRARRLRCRATAGSPRARTPRGTLSASGRATRRRGADRPHRLDGRHCARIELAEHTGRRHRPAVALLSRLIQLLAHPSENEVSVPAVT